MTVMRTMKKSKQGLEVMRPHKEHIRDWYETLGGREHVYTEYILEVRNEAIESTVVQ